MSETRDDDLLPPYSPHRDLITYIEAGPRKRAPIALSDGRGNLPPYSPDRSLITYMEAGPRKRKTRHAETGTRRRT